MATKSYSNPEPFFDLPVFIPENWGNIGDGNSTSVSTTSLQTAFIGQITIFEGSTLPAYWVWCDGTLYSTSVYADLFGFIGYTYGGSGGNFAVPNCLGKSPYGADNTGVLTADYQGSSISSSGNRTLNTGQLISHNHSVTISPTTMIQNVFKNEAQRGQNIPSGPDSFKNPITSGANLAVSAADAGASADLLPPFCVVKYIIKAL